jgi:signal recognition particle subunit SRP54
MFDRFSQKIQSIVRSMRQKGALTEADVDATLREIRIALLEADVALPVVKKMVLDIRNEAIGSRIIQSINPAQMIVKIVHDHLVAILGSPEPLRLRGSPAMLMVAGLQGSGKTTSCAKIGHFLTQRTKKKVLLVSLDVYRPAAQKQLEILAERHQLASLPIQEGEKPMAILQRAMAWSQTHCIDVVILDTAGRLHIDESMMDELKSLKAQANPSDILLVADAMTGQDAVRTAQTFHEALSLTGLVLTRADGDGRGGAALSMRQMTQCPIQFLGVGEKIHQLEAFDPKRIADRILDMGDVVALVEHAQILMEEQDSEALAKTMAKGRFTLNEFALAMQQMRKAGGASSLFSMMPGFQAMSAHIDPQRVERDAKRDLAVIQSMTALERRSPTVLNASRRKRIAKGAGVDVATVNRLIKKFDAAQLMVKKFSKMGLKDQVRMGLSKFFG